MHRAQAAENSSSATCQPAFLTGYRREGAEMPVGEPDKDECPVDARPGEREIHGGISPARQATQDCEAQAARRASENARRRSLHYVEHTTERDAGRYAAAVDSW